MFVRLRQRLQALSPREYVLVFIALSFLLLVAAGLVFVLPTFMQSKALRDSQDNIRTLYRQLEAESVKRRSAEAQIERKQPEAESMDAKQLDSPVWRLAGRLQVTDKRFEVFERAGKLWIHESEEYGVTFQGKRVSAWSGEGGSRQVHRAFDGVIIPDGLSALPGLGAGKDKPADKD